MEKEQAMGNISKADREQRMAALLAKNNPVAGDRPVVDAQINVAAAPEFSVEGLIGFGDAVESIHAPDLKKMAEDEIFMNEKLTIQIVDSATPEDRIVAEVTCGSQRCVIPRGKPHSAPRKFIEILARCRTTRLVPVETRPNDPGSLVYRSRAVLDFPFTVLADPSGSRGAAWLKGLYAEA
jgi:hypothetical protein